MTPPPMTPKEFKEAIEEAYKPSDLSYYAIEDAHIKADNLMCKVLRDLGYGEGIDVFEKAVKWYA